jgi:methionine synthase II (cobalamin-independent)
MVEPTLSGLYPRDNELIRTTWNTDKGLATTSELETAQERATQAVLALQAQIGANDATDGQFRWQDLLRPLAEATEGVEVGGLVRFHETNTFLRRPILKAAFDESSFDAQAFLKATSPQLWTQSRPKIVLPAPNWLQTASEGDAYPDPLDAAQAWARVLNQAARAAEKAGAAVVQFNDPVLLHSANPDIEGARRLLGLATKGLEVETCYYAYAGDAGPHWNELTRFPCHRLGIDFLETELDELGDLPNNKNLLAGVIDSRSSLVEPTPVLSAFVERLSDRFDSRRIQVTHSYDLEFVPPEVALAKVRNLSQSCRLTQEVAQ